MPQVARQMPAMVAAPPPSYDAPHDFFMLAMVTTIICGILNLVSLAFGIPAIVLSAMVTSVYIMYNNYIVIIRNCHSKAIFVFVNQVTTLHL